MRRHFGKITSAISITLLFSIFTCYAIRDESHFDREWILWIVIIFSFFLIAVVGKNHDITSTKLKNKMKETKQLEFEYKKYFSLYELIPNMVCIFDMKGNIVDCNQHTIERLGYDKKFITSHKFSYFLANKEDRTKILDYFYKSIKGRSYRYETTLIQKDGGIIPVHILNTPIKVDGKIIGLFGMAKELTELKNTYEQLLENKNKYKSLFENNMDSVFSLSVDGKFTEINTVGAEIIGYTQDEIIGRSFMELVVSECLPKAIYLFEKAKNGEPSRGEIQIIHKKGHYVDLEVRAIPITIKDKIEGVFSITRDITVQKEKEKTIERLAFQDSLTNLPNRRYFLDILKRTIDMYKDQENIFAVLFLDQDKLKFVNDTYGHDAGDQLIKKAADLLKNSVNETDVVARLGGDEFGIVLTSIKTIEEVKEVARSILSKYEEPFYIQDKIIYTGISIGIALYPVHGDSSEMLLRHADIAMYKVKVSGRNGWNMYEDHMQEELNFKTNLENEMHGALKNDEFELYYQPRIDPRTLKIVGAEALIRWNHPKRGFISPQEFIPLAEESGFIIPLGNWIINTACQQNKMWQKMGYEPIRVAVNVSPRQFFQNDIYKEVKTALLMANLEPKYLEIEITERVLMDNEENILNTLKKLKDLGVHISIDDFGTGYSSLTYLKQFEIHSLKIDRSFIKDLNTNKQNSLITQALIQLAHSLNLSVVAEGVETKEEKEFLTLLGSDELQGYFFHKPLPAAEHEKLLWQKNRGEL